jgi:hypothetical protein
MSTKGVPAAERGAPFLFCAAFVGRQCLDLKQVAACLGKARIQGCGISLPSRV